jgi:hypothetical protein
LSAGDASCLARSSPLHRTVYDIDRNSPRRFLPLWRLRSRASRSSVMNGHRPSTVRSVPYRADVSFVEYFRFRNKSRSLPTSGALGETSLSTKLCHRGPAHMGQAAALPLARSHQTVPVSHHPTSYQNFAQLQAYHQGAQIHMISEISCPETQQQSSLSSTRRWFQVLDLGN